MKTKLFFGALATALIAIGATQAIAADKADVGKKEYESNCVSCHGKDLRGGAYVDVLKVTPPDLTQLSKKNGGVFPIERVYMMIDGREEVKAHGSREMPVWGQVYQVKAGEFYVDSPYDPEAFIRGRILALIDYLSRMQSK